jgi:ABC-type branched-subunit amino acid transport system ATPase component/MFS family permease
VSRLTRWFRELGGGAGLFPLFVLFGLTAVEQLDQRAFDVLLPNIRDTFGLDTQAILAVVGLTGAAALVIAVPIGYYADRLSRVRIATFGALAWAVFSVLTGLAPALWVLGLARAGSGLGAATIVPTHNSLLADYYDIPERANVYAAHRAAYAIGACIGPLFAGLLGFYFGWRTPFIVYALPTLVFVLLSLRLREPVRGHFERAAMGVSDEVQATEDIPPSIAESWRIIWSVGTLRRVFYALPFLAVAFLGLLSLSSLYYSQVFHLDERARGYIAAAVEPGQLVGLFAGVPIATRLLARDAALVLRFLAVVAAIVGVAWIGFALSPWLWLAITMNIVVSSVVVILIPGIFAALSLAIPPKVRAFGFSVAGLWILPGLLLLPIIGGAADSWGIRPGLMLMVPVFLIGALIIASAGGEVNADIRRVWAAAAAQAEVLYDRRQGRVKLLLVRGVDVHYDGVQVLFNVDFEIDEGEIVALLGTNGAGKSTLLKAISGLVQASGGAIVFDGRDMTHTPPDEIATRGVTQVPGGQGVFPSLTVAENLQLAGWLRRGDPEYLHTATERVLEIFPVLRDRLGEVAGNLSGGQQQMLTLGMAFIERPRLLMIDELSLGLAPAVIEQLLEIVRDLRERGTTIILVEQSVNVALTVAETAYFMEKGEIRFHGPTAELLERPDVLRSVFLEGAASVANGASSGRATSPTSVPVNGGPPSAGAATPRSQVEVRLQVRDVAKSFGGIDALRNVSFDVHSNEVLGFIGPNGAGKTTLFDVISGFLVPDRGTIVLATGGGVLDLSRRSPQYRARHGLGRSFQDGRLFPALTVAETIAVALETHVEVRDPIAAALNLPAVVDSEHAVAERVDELIELMGLGAFRDKFVRELSTGSRRILDLACVLAHGPEVLLLDEPSSGIAQREAEALGPLLLRIRDALGASILVIEHDLPLLASMADRMIALDLGEVIATGTPAEVVHEPRVVASYLGTTAAAVARSGARPGAPIPEE